MNHLDNEDSNIPSIKENILLKSLTPLSKENIQLDEEEIKSYNKDVCDELEK